MIQSGQNIYKSIERLYETPLSAEEKSEASRNLAGFLNLLIKIDQSSNSAK